MPERKFRGNTEEPGNRSKDEAVSYVTVRMIGYPAKTDLDLAPRLNFKHAGLEWNRAVGQSLRSFPVATGTAIGELNHGVGKTVDPSADLCPGSFFPSAVPDPGRFVCTYTAPAVGRLSTPGAPPRKQTAGQAKSRAEEVHEEGGRITGRNREVGPRWGGNQTALA